MRPDLTGPYNSQLLVKLVPSGTRSMHLPHPFASAQKGENPIKIRGRSKTKLGVLSETPSASATSAAE
jgi:hypothetical protein